ncbi:hypothetical protein SYNGFB01_06600 [Synechococcus sp. GFB01]|nr:hypothetical protein [Synechococcus sp. GFB01]KMM17066.1 hypothetical protein SYNGFB01_06600 [Synechococcus sp. GFB01]
MAFPQSSPNGASWSHRPAFRPAANPRSSLRTAERDHQLEKLEFALAVAGSRGDLQRCTMLRQQIEALGGNLEEPGT